VTLAHIVWVVATTGGAIAFGLWLMGINHQLPSFGDHYEVKTVLPTVASLARDSRVTMAGVEVGKVESFKRRGIGAEVTLRITDERVTPIPADSRIALRMRTPLSENYFEIRPGSSKTDLKSGATVAASQNEEYVDVDEILSMLQGPTRQHARQLLQGVGGTLDGRGNDLNALLGGAAETVSRGSDFMEIGARNREAVRGLIRQLGHVTAAVGERDGAITDIGQHGLVALRAVAGRDRALRSTLDELPPLLSTVRRTMGTVDATSRTATPVVANLTASVRDLRPAVRVLSPAARTGQAVLAELRAAAPVLSRTLREVTKLSQPATKALPPLRKTLCQVNPILRYARPYTPDFIQTVVGLGSGSNSYDAIGHTLRLAPTINDSSLVGLPDNVNKAAYTLLHTGLLAKTSGALTWDPYPRPGQVGRSRASNGPLIMGPKELAESGFKYPRIQADC
jgi:phospholipid/cholesterol/gamma-HCH transport system substrate-binding protein